LFISEKRLDAWSSEDRVKIDADIMTLSGDGRSFRLKPAVRFMKISGGDGQDDPMKLIGKVKLVEFVTKQGGEHLGSSVILGEIAYDVQSGFLGEPQGG
jgi:hypothetical protein